nr:hypothetical transcript [Hymenolepis microstoma]
MRSGKSKDTISCSTDLKDKDCNPADYRQPVLAGQFTSQYQQPEDIKIAYFVTGLQTIEGDKPKLYVTKLYAYSPTLHVDLNNTPNGIEDTTIEKIFYEPIWIQPVSSHNENFGYHSIEALCSQCNRSIITEINLRIGIKVYTLCTTISLFGGVFGCFLIPFFMKNFQDLLTVRAVFAFYLFIIDRI